MNPNRRREEILEMIIDRYIESAEPVGSRAISRKLGLSSATIRNVMSDLEDEGYITHPHTSAGRIPTDKGYRYYITTLMHRKNLNEKMVKMVEAQYHQKVENLGDVLEKTSHLISSLTNYVGVTMMPGVEKLYFDGTSHLMEQPEFQDISKLHNLFKCLEDRVSILKVLCDSPDDDRLTIHIGKENKSSSLSECSIVTRGYKIKGKASGKLGVIGPKRMVYERVIPMVEYLADTVSNILYDMDE
ncbi:MAG: winged helix-turn-helix transcriptional regulator [Candidatus Omnitrophica bacterium]|nr:winged helix-turn-helix transcriptional regulator [Candidatus Omnitrophota bacterium]